MTTSTIEPTSVRAGDSIAWVKTLTDYPASAGWVLAYRLINSAGKIDITSTASGDDHAVAVTAATSAAFVPGFYTWVAHVTKAGERYTVGEGSITIDPDLAAKTTGFDTRTHAGKMLAAIESWIESKDPGVAEYEIAGRRMKYIPTGDLLVLRDKYRLEVQRDQAGARAAAGLSPRNKIFVRV